MAVRVDDEPDSRRLTTLAGPNEIESFPEGGKSSWSVVVGCFALLTASWGMMMSVGILQAYFEANQLREFTTGQIGWIPGVFVFVGLTVGIQIGPLFDRYGPTKILLFGTASYTASFLVLAQCQKYWQIMLCLGVWAGASAACLSTTAVSVIPHYFRRRVGLAMGVALSGCGFGGVIFPFILRAGFNDLGWKWTIRLLGFIVGALGALGMALVKSRLPRHVAKGVLNLRSFKDSRFTLLTLGLFFLEFDMYAILGLLPTFVLAMGYSSTHATAVVSVLNGCALIGSFANGPLADRFGRLNSLLIIPIAGTACVFAIWLPLRSTLPGLYIFSALFGLLNGAFTNVAPACISQISSTFEMGSRMGTCYCLMSFASLISIPLGGEVLTKVGPQKLVIMLGSLIVAAVVSCTTARWACLGYQWRWRVKI